MELGPKTKRGMVFLGPNSIGSAYMDPVGNKGFYKGPIGDLQGCVIEAPKDQIMRYLGA